MGQSPGVAMLGGGDESKHSRVLLLLFLENPLCFLEGRRQSEWHAQGELPHTFSLVLGAYSSGIQGLEHSVLGAQNSFT